MNRTGVVLAAAAVGVGKVLLRARLAHWGATDVEVRGALLGDELVAHANVTTTRAITVHAPAAAVWPWLAQLGQGRGGFYSYDAVENLLGMDIHSAERIVAEWQSVEVGMQIRLAADVPLTVALVERGRALVLRGSVPMGQVPVPYDFTWAFVWWCRVWSSVAGTHDGAPLPPVGMVPFDQRICGSGRRGPERVTDPSSCPSRGVRAS